MSAAHLVCMVPGILIASGSLSSAATTTTHPRVNLTISPCLSVAPSEVRRIVAIELGALLDEGPASADTTGVEVTCRDRLTGLHVNDPITGKSLDRAINLETLAANSHSRLLALAIAELVAASWTELETNPRPAVVPVAAQPVSVVAKKVALASVVQRRASSEPRRPMWSLGAAASTQIFFAGSGTLLGGGVEVERRLAQRVALRLDAFAHHGSADHSLGSISVDTLSLGLTAALFRDWSRFRAHVAAGVRGGAAQLSGAPVDASATIGNGIWGAWGGPLGHVGVRMAIGRFLNARVGIEGGYVVVPVGALANSTRVVAIDGAWIGVQLGIGFAL